MAKAHGIVQDVRVDGNHLWVEVDHVLIELNDQQAELLMQRIMYIHHSIFGVDNPSSDSPEA